MPSAHFCAESLVAQIEKTSQFNSEVTSRLSDWIRDIKCRLQELAFKQEVSIEAHDEEYLCVSFQRWAGEGWSLVASTVPESGWDNHPDCPIELTSAPIEMKMRAAPLLVPLLEKIKGNQEKVAEQCRALLVVMDSVVLPSDADGKTNSKLHRLRAFARGKAPPAQAEITDSNESSQTPAEEGGASVPF